MESKHYSHSSKILLFIGIILIYGCKQSNNYSTYRGDNANTGVYSSEEIKAPQLKWKTDLNGTVHSSPTLMNGIAYIGSGDGNLYAIETDKGEVLWNFKTKGAIHSTPTISNNKIFFTSHDGYFYALNRKSGKEIWKFRTKGEKLFSALNLFGWESPDVELSDYWDFYLSSPYIRRWFGVLWKW